MPSFKRLLQMSCNRFVSTAFRFLRMDMSVALRKTLCARVVWQRPAADNPTTYDSRDGREGKEGVDILSAQRPIPAGN